MADIVCDIRNHLLTMAPHQRQRLTAWQLRVAADEIARLREAIRRLAEQDATLSVQGGNVIVQMDATLTEAERGALRTVIGGFGMWVAQNGLTDDESLRLAVVALRGLLERHFPTPENPPSQDNTPDTHSNQSEVSVRPECAISPPWMARPFWVDPASGWEYGFPQLYDPAKDGDLTTWLVANGYPQHLADQNLPCTFTAKTDAQ